MNEQLKNAAINLLAGFENKKVTVQDLEMAEGSMVVRSMALEINAYKMIKEPFVIH